MNILQVTRFLVVGQFAELLNLLAFRQAQGPALGEGPAFLWRRLPGMV